MALKFNPLAPGGFVNIPASGGAEGPPGPKGEFNYRGAYVKQAWAKGDATTVGGTTYACIKAMTEGESVEPPNATFWKVIAEKGAAGANGQGVPVGGTTGQVLKKKSNADFDDEWATLAGGAPSGPAGGDLAGEYPNPTIGAEKVIAARIGPEAVETSKIKDKAVTDKKLAGLTWENVEAVNANLTQTTTIQVAVFNGLVFMRGLGKASAEIVAKGILFTLPAAARPAVERHALYNNNLGSSTATLNIKTNGEVQTEQLMAINKTPSFDGIFFSL